MNRITPGQLFTLLVVMNVGNITQIITLSVPIAGFASPLSVIVAIGLGLLVSWLALLLAVRLPSHNFLLHGASIVGKPFHKAAVVLFFLYFLLRASFELRGLVYQINSIYLPETPPIAIALLFGIVAAIAVRYGIMTITYIAQYFALPIFPVFILLTGLSLSMPVRFEMMTAFITHLNAQEIPKALLSGLMGTHWVGECFFVLFLAPILTDMKKTRSAVFAGLGFMAIQTLVHLMTIILSFGPVVAGSMAFPISEQLRFIRVSDFLENLDPFLLLHLFPIVAIKISLYIYLASMMLGDLLSMRDLRPLSFAITALVGAVAFHMVARMTELPMFIQMFWTWFALFVQLVPAVYLTVAKIRSLIDRQGTRTPRSESSAAE